VSNDENMAKLLQQNIEASNRTTHAVRAFVRFLFIQLSFLTTAYIVWQLGLAFPDASNCTPFGCQPNWFVSVLVAVLIIAGVIASSIAGWSELELSSIPSNRPSSGFNGIERNNLEAKPRTAVAQSRVCPNCKKVYTTGVSCTDCDAWLVQEA
jgi:hypothetical protein